jgi:fatty acid desaturase
LDAIFTFGLLAISIVLLFLADALWLRLLDAALLAFTFTHLAFFIHDAGHRQILGRAWQNDAVMLLIGFFLGSSRSWWFETHNSHHAHPNDLERDPNTALPVFAFSRDQARRRGKLAQALTRFQAYYFFPVLCLQSLGARAASIQFLLAGTSKYPVLEAFAIGVHFAVYGVLLFNLMPIRDALLFIFVHQGLAGLYMGSVFAPNHKGMLIPNEETSLDFIRKQVLSSRNIRPHPLIDFCYGGLNYQIEHHLFPSIPRSKLKEARTVVRAFCAEHAIAYHETGLLRAYAEVLGYLEEVVRRPARTGSARIDLAVTTQTERP